MFIFFAFFGLIALITGIFLRKKFKKKTWCILIWVGVLSVFIAAVLFVCTILLVNRQDVNVPIDPIEDDVCGRDWWTWRGYTENYELNENLTVCFSAVDSDDFYGVYDASDGTRIGSLQLGEYTAKDTDGFEIADYNGDGINDIGVKLDNGQVLKYCHDSESEPWPDDVTGGYKLYND